MTATRFRSRIDAVIGLVLLAPIGLMVYLLIAGRRDGVGTPMLVVVSLAAVVTLIGWIVLDTSYELTERDLLVRSGPQRSAAFSGSPRDHPPGPPKPHVDRRTGAVTPSAGDRSRHRTRGRHLTCAGDRVSRAVARTSPVD